MTAFLKYIFTNGQILIFSWLYLSGMEAVDSSDLVKSWDFAGRPDLNLLILALLLDKVTYF